MRASLALSLSLSVLLPLSACATSQVSAVLDDFHAAAAEADEERYFGHFAKDGVFLGTDATERWTVEEFRAYAHPHFAKGNGWAYVPEERHIAVDGDYAWFDELLQNAAYGELRGSGVLRREEGAWRVVQYNLAFTVPNEAAADVVARIKQTPRGRR